MTKQRRIKISAEELNEYRQELKQRLSKIDEENEKIRKSLEMSHKRLHECFAL